MIRKWWVVSLVMVGFLAIPSALRAWPIPDTGQTTCYDASGSVVDCADSGQDGEYLINPPSYTKLDENGNDLSDTATQWTMVRDNVTGLIWEVKTDDGSVHDKDNTYTWYDSDPATNGGDAGDLGGGNNTQAFIESLNAGSGFGGFTDWRLPTREELRSIADYSGNDPAIDTGYFPNTVSADYWSSSTVADYDDSAWGVRFSHGGDRYDPKTGTLYVRAVRGGQGAALDHWVIGSGDTVTDTRTGLMWRRTTDSTTRTWTEALSHCESMTTAGYDDWRLPTVKELASITALDRSNPAIDTSYFLGTFSSYYWSSSSYANGPGDAWNVTFDDGWDRFSPKSDSLYVHAVRGGQVRLLGHLFITNPTQASKWSPGCPMEITWDTQSIPGNVDILLSIDGGSTFDPILSNTPNDGNHPWTVPNSPSADCVLKIVPLDQPDKETSVGLFSIVDTGTAGLPQISSIAPGGPSPTPSSAVTFTATFSEAVFELTQDHFTLATTGSVTGASITGFSGSGATYTLQVEGISGDGTVGLNFIADCLVKDNDALPVTNDLIGTTVTIDQTPPSVQSIILAGTSPTAASEVVFNVTFSETVQNVDATDFQVTETDSLSGSSITGVTQSGNQWDVTVSGYSGLGNLTLEVVDDDTILDLVGNPLGGSGAGNGDFIDGPSYQIIPPTYTLNIDLQPAGSGTVTGQITNSTVVDPDTGEPFASGTVAEFTCADQCSIFVTGGSSVALSAAPSSGFVFSQWTGVDASNGTSASLSVASDQGIGAAFLGDRDEDGTPDSADGCPDDRWKIAPGQCGCGVSEVDSDEDGVLDCVDGCDNDPVKISPGQCGCGEPETDTDGDGTPDCVDGCDDDAAKTEPGVCGCGTPDVDSDEDGAMDCEDDCPEDPNKTEPGECGCGVSDADQNEDGVPDCKDECPDDPEKTEPGVCGCGTPDVDSDGDGALDCQEECPEDPAKTEPGVCGCGTPDVDSDGDGALDCQDDCPEDPEKTEPGDCGCGVPETGDRDEDGTLDCIDECPDDPAKTQPEVCGCGVPDDDADGDGTPDCLDECPDDPAKITPGDCGCGVPETGDRDGDGTPDCMDQCPDDDVKTSPGACGCGISDADSDGNGVADCLEGDEDDADSDDTDDSGYIQLEPQTVAPEDGAFLESEDVALEGLLFLGEGTGEPVETYCWIRPIDKPTEFQKLNRTGYGGIVKYRPGDLIQGLRYIWRFGCRHPQTGEMRWTDFRTFTVGIPEEMEGPEIEPGTAQADFQMGSFCAWPVASDIVALLEGRIGPYDPKNYRIGAWDPEAGAYVEYSDNLSLLPGRSIWFLARNGLLPQFRGVPVSSEADLQVELHFSEDTQTGWNQIGCPNNADYRWGDVELIAFDPEDDGDEFERTYGPVPLSGLPADNPYIRLELWRYADGSYIDLLPDEEAAVLVRDEGYWVAAKRDHVALVFPASAQEDLGPRQIRMVRSLRRVRRFVEAHIGPPNAIAQSAETPPLPMDGLSGGTIEDRAGGYSSGGGGACFIESATR